MTSFMNMDSNRQEVYSFVCKNFKLDEMWMKEFPMLPGGILLEDVNGGEILCYWDILKQKVKWEVR